MLLTLFTCGVQIVALIASVPWRSELEALDFSAKVRVEIDLDWNGLTHSNIVPLQLLEEVDWRTSFETCHARGLFLYDTEIRVRLLNITANTTVATMRTVILEHLNILQPI